MAGTKGSLDREVLSGRRHNANGDGNGGHSEWFLELGGPGQFCASLCGNSNAGGVNTTGDSAIRHGQPGQQQNNCSFSCCCDTDSGYEPSPAYFAGERRFEYPPIQGLEEEEADDDELDEVFLDPPTFLSELPSTPRSCAIPIPIGRQSTPSDHQNDLDDDDDDDEDGGSNKAKQCRPQSCPLRTPGGVLDDDDDEDDDDDDDDDEDNDNDDDDDDPDADFAVGGRRRRRSRNDEGYDAAAAIGLFDDEELNGSFEAYHSVSTQTEWLFDEEVAAASNRRRATVANIPDVVPRRSSRTLPRRAASFNEADYLTVGRDLRRLSDNWESGRFQRRVVDRRQTFIGFVMDAILANEAPRRPRMPRTLLR